MTDSVSILGLGNMGHALAARLVTEGFGVTGWSRSGGDARQAEHAGYRLTADLADAAAASDIILTSLFDGVAVGAMVARLAKLPLEGKLIVETSTIAPSELLECVAGLHAAGALVIDAPISGGPDMIANGTIGIFLGGPEAAVARFLPVAGHLSNRFAHIGDLGAGYATKIMNNVVLAGSIQAMIEGLQVGQALGLPKDIMLDVLEKGPAITPMLKDRIPKIRGEDDSVGFALNGAVVDSALFVETAKAAGVDLKLVPEMQKSYQAAVDAGFGDQDVAVAIRNRLGWI